MSNRSVPDEHPIGNGGRHRELFAMLAAPFAGPDVKTRPQGGRTLSYVTARTVMNRLDQVLGPEGWWDSYTPQANSVLCELSILLPDGRVLTKADAGGYAGMQDQGDDDKSGYSDAFKRAAVKFGVGRHLYQDGIPPFAVEVLGLESRPAAEPPRQQHREPEPPRVNYGDNRNGFGPRPRSGRALFAWVKEQEQKHDNEIRLLHYMNSWGKLQEFPGRMIDWSEDQCGRAFDEACRKLRALQPDHSDADANLAATEAEGRADEVPF